MKRKNNLIVKLSTISYRLSTNGLTLIEIMIVVAILAVMSSTLFSVFQGSLLSQRRGTNKAIIYSEARAALEMMSREIEKAMVDERIGVECLGTPLTKIETNSVADEFFFIIPTNNTGTADLCEVGYWLKNAPNESPPVINTLMRHYETSIADYDFDTASGEYALIGNVSDLKFEYFAFDTSTLQWIWFTNWHDVGNSVAVLPRAIKITLVMEYEPEKDEIRQDTFITVVNIPGSGQ